MSSHGERWALIQNLQFACCRFESVAFVAAHPFIVWLHACMRTSEGDLALLMEYAAGGSVAHRICREADDQLHTAIAENVAAIWTAQIMLALRHLHSVGVLHRDLKVDNILLDGNDVAKLADFGLARHSGPSLEADSLVGTRQYMAPEIGTADYGGAVDVYSMGVCVFMMLTGGEPLRPRKCSQESCDLPEDDTGGMVEKMEGITKSMLWTMDDLMSKERLPERRAPDSHEELLQHLNDEAWMSHLSADAVGIMKQMCSELPIGRGTTQSLCRHPWLAKECMKWGLRVSKRARTSSVRVEEESEDSFQGPLAMLRGWSQDLGSRPGFSGLFK
mmetsp:Transcript_48412/g.109895  ORF Transcript_48412/g.109895 Transcript_48412/m.109895 type:complete len:332 (+) Transcript_48412:132-1127(+)